MDLAVFQRVILCTHGRGRDVDFAVCMMNMTILRSAFVSSRDGKGAYSGGQHSGSEGKLGLSQTFPVVAKCSGIGQYSGFINHLKSEAEREQFVLSTNGPLPSKVEAFLEPEHRLEARDRSLRRGERSETSGFRHVLLHVKVIAFNPLLQVLGDAVLHVGRRQAVPGAVLYGLGIDTRAVRPDLARGQHGLVLQSLAEKPLGGGEIAPGRKQKID